jgi:hypothetical protein
MSKRRTGRIMRAEYSRLELSNITTAYPHMWFFPNQIARPLFSIRCLLDSRSTMPIWALLITSESSYTTPASWPITAICYTPRFCAVAPLVDIFVVEVVLARFLRCYSLLKLLIHCQEMIYRIKDADLLVTLVMVYQAIAILVRTRKAVNSLVDD